MEQNSFRSWELFKDIIFSFKANKSLALHLNFYTTSYSDRQIITNQIKMFLFLDKI